MKYLKYFCLIILTILFACQSKNDKHEKQAEILADKFCHCAGPAAQAMSDLKNATDEDRIALSQETIKQNNSLAECIGQDEERDLMFKEMTGDERMFFEEKYRNAINEMCPDIAKAFNYTDDAGE